MDEVERMLTLLASGFPQVETLAPQEARRIVAERVRPAPPSPVVGEDRWLPATGAESALRVRVYRPPHTAGGADGDRPVGPDRRPPCVVFLHGGGFVLCSIESHDGYCRAVAAETGAVVVSVDYRLAPEHPAPAALDDAVRALAWAASAADELGTDSRLVVMGDSAGGNLAACAALVSRGTAYAPVAQVLLYPVIDPACDSESQRLFADGPYNTRAAMQWYWRQYLGGADLPHPPELVAPLRAADLAGAPPAVVVTAGRDPLRDEGIAYARALRAAGTTVRHRHFGELFHGFATLADFGPARTARELVAADLTHLLTAPTP